MATDTATATLTLTGRTKAEPVPFALLLLMPIPLRTYRPLRLALFALSTAAAALAAGWSAAQARWEKQPTLAVPAWGRSSLHQLLANDAALASPSQDPESIERIRATAQAVLRATPLDTTALRQLAMVDQATGRQAAQLLIDQAERVTRRDLSTELLQIERAAQARDLSGALRHYDHALTVHPDVSVRLFPLLARALAADAVRTALIPYAARPWMSRFLAGAIAEGAEGEAVAATVVMLRARLATGEADRLTPRLIDDLLARQQAGAARALVQAQPEFIAGLLDNLGFTHSSTDTRLGRLGWRLATASQVEAQLEQGEWVAVNANGEHYAIAAERQTLLPPGRYRFSFTIDYAADAPRARISWEVRCSGSGGAMIWRSVLPTASAKVRYLSEFAVADGCPIQSWRLRAMGDVSQSVSQARIGELRLEGA